MSEANDISAMSFEAAVAELERIVEQLERGDVPLDKSADWKILIPAMHRPATRSNS